MYRFNNPIILKSFKKCFSFSRNQSKVASKSSDNQHHPWNSVVGLEVHAQLATNSKLFSGSANSFGAPLNSSVSLFDAAIPGTLPVLNRQCVELAIKTALALNCKINPISLFDRKHYFYADLPAGYQITQQRAPIARDGHITFPVLPPDGKRKLYYKTVRLQQIQLEQDSGKSLHDDTAGKSLVDLNRAGVPLIELVFLPDIRDGEEAAWLIKELVLILKAVESCSCKMEEGALRVDANVSLHKANEPLGTRTETKNIGSVRNVAQAVSYEIGRQRSLLDAGKEIQNETRAWDALAKQTVPMRDKEVQQDYRFMPEPNLPPLLLALNASQAINEDIINVQRIAESMPELPDKRRTELASEYNLPKETCIILVNEDTLFDYFTNVLKSNPHIPPKAVCNFLINDLLTFCNRENIRIEECRISNEQFIELFDLLESQVINLYFARLLLDEMHANPMRKPAEIIAEKNWKLINNPIEIEKICIDCIADNPKVVRQYLQGKEKLFYALVGEVAKKSEQRANMALAVDILKSILNKMKRKDS